MSNISSVAASPPVTGITRDCDLALDTTGSREVGTGYSQVRNLRTGIQFNSNQIGVVVSECKVALLNGIAVPAVSSGLGNGAAIQYGFPVQGDAALALFEPAAYSFRRGVTRIVSTMSADTAETPNNDVGMQAVIGGNTLCELLPVTGGGVGKTGFGIWMIAGAWKWGIKVAADAAGSLSDTVAILSSHGIPIVITAPTQIEFRIFDSSGGPASAKANARVELWVQNILQLTRYWTNPVGVTTPVLPTLVGAIYAQIRNTSTGPAHAYFGQFGVAHGPNNEGTLSDA